jgi:NADH-quinone oxidoreductase subunit N
MRPTDVIALLPLLVLALASVGALLVIAIYRSYPLVFGLICLGLLLALACCVPALHVAPAQVTPLLRIDPYAIFFIGLLAASSLAIALFAYRYWQRDGNRNEEFYLLMALGTLGGMVLVSSTHFATFFLGLELLSAAIYILAAYDRHREIGTEASIKYLILAGVSSAFILFGMVLVYSVTGTMQLAGRIELHRWLIG